MKFKKILNTTLNEMALGDIVRAVIFSVDAEGLRNDFFDYYIKELRDRGISDKKKIASQINNDISNLKKYISGQKKSPTLENIEGMDDETWRIVLNQLIKGKKSLSPEQRDGKRSSNEKLVNNLIRILSLENEIPVIMFNTKGTKINRDFISRLKLDQEVEILGNERFYFETKKGSIRTLKSPGGLLFAELHKKFTDKKKKEIEELYNTDEKFKEKVDKHNISVEKLFTQEIIKQIEKEIEASDYKPYLIVGNEEDENNIYVVYPDEYYLEVRLVDFSNILRVGIYAKLKNNVEFSDIKTIKEFFTRMVVESSVRSLIK